jgi:hypothetical protein
MTYDKLSQAALLSKRWFVQYETTHNSNVTMQARITIPAVAINVILMLCSSLEIQLRYLQATSQLLNDATVRTALIINGIAYSVTKTTTFIQSQLN